MDNSSLVHIRRPSYEGSNIRTWVGFKHFMYLVEEAVLGWFRDHGHGPQHLYESFGLGLEIVESSVLLPGLLFTDDLVAAGVRKTGPGKFHVQLGVRRQTADAVALQGRVIVALVQERRVSGRFSPPEGLADIIVGEIAETSDTAQRRDIPGVSPETISSALDCPGAFLWSWVARYFHCHFSDRVQHSAYIRALEEIVDRFLAHRGMSVGTMLHERGWIPVVSRVRLRMMADARMEETIHTTFAVEEFIKDVAFIARMDCYVHRGDRLVHTASGHVMHGYAMSDGEDAGRLVTLDAAVRAILSGRAKT